MVFHCLGCGCSSVVLVLAWHWEILSFKFLLFFFFFPYLEWLQSGPSARCISKNKIDCDTWYKTVLRIQHFFNVEIPKLVNSHCPNWNRDRVCKAPKHLIAKPLQIPNIFFVWLKLEIRRMFSCFLFNCITLLRYLNEHRKLSDCRRHRITPQT